MTNHVLHDARDQPSKECDKEGTTGEDIVDSAIPKKAIKDRIGDGKGVAE